MNKIKELFFASKQDKLTDKAFTQSIAVSVISILVSVVALCSVTWAWFSEGVTSSSNTIKTGNCTVTVSVMNEETEIDPNTDTTGIYTFEAGKSYQIKISSTGSVESSYCKLVIDGNEYYTFIDDKFCEFYPESHSVGKWLHCTEEMHRFEGGKWQNFPDADTRYETQEIPLPR